MIAIPRRVFVFSGHLVDAAGRATPRFPNDTATIERVRRALAEVLESCAAGPGDLALTQGACGGDLLFSALCIERRLALRWLQPATEETFIEGSVARGGQGWRELYAALRESLDLPPQAMPAVLGAALDAAADPYARCNRWLLDTARAYGLDKLQLIALWDFDADDRAGGTADMIEDARQLTDRIALVDILASTSRSPGAA